jgi:hypothetical protein
MSRAGGANVLDPSEEARNIAAFSLGQLLQKDSSVESGLRAMLRIATMRGHLWWQAWAFMQLTNFYEPDAMDGVHLLIESAFPDAERRSGLLESAMASVRETRIVGASDPPKYYLADVGDLERDLPIFEARLLRKITVERSAQRDMRRTILNRIKNRVQIYLMAIENGATLPRESDEA